MPLLVAVWGVFFPMLGMLPSTLPDQGFPNALRLLQQAVYSDVLIILMVEGCLQYGFVLGVALPALSRQTKPNTDQSFYDIKLFCLKSSNQLVIR